MTRFHFRHPIYRPVPRDSLPRSAAGLCEWLVQLAGSLFQARPAAPVAAPGWFPSPLSNRASILPVTLLFFLRSPPVVGWLQLLAGCYGQDSSKGQLQDDRAAAAEEFAASVTPTTVWTPTCVFSSAGWSLGASVTALRLALNTPSPMLTLADEDPEKKKSAFNGDSTQTVQ